jgi:hypothetical protein
LEANDNSLVQKQQDVTEFLAEEKRNSELKMDLMQAETRKTELWDRFGKLLNVATPVFLNVLHMATQGPSAGIRGIRYKCSICPIFDLCEDCEENGSHRPDHPMLTIVKPIIYE